MLTWAVAYTIVHASVQGTALLAGIEGDVLLALIAGAMLSDYWKRRR